MNDSLQHPSKPRQLFIAGPGRSGTSALKDYLNEHPRVALTMERYKKVHEQITPELFTFDRVLDIKEEETNRSRAEQERAIQGKREEDLAYFGDKHPGLFCSMETVTENCPGCQWLFTYRPLEPVAASHFVRSQNPDDYWLGGRDGVEVAIQDWNRAYRNLRRFVRSHPEVPLMVVPYRSFFANPVVWARRISEFLELPFPEEIVARWRALSAAHEASHGPARLDKEQLERVREGKDEEAEQWVLGYMAGQNSKAPAIRRQYLARQNQLLNSRLAARRYVVADRVAEILFRVPGLATLVNRPSRKKTR